MSVVTVVTVVPSRIEGVVEYVRGRSVSDDELVDALAPPSLRRSDPTMIRDVVSACVDMGLLLRTNDNWTLVPKLKNRSELRAFLTDVIVGPGRSEASQADVAEALAWFLTCDPSDPPSITENWPGAAGRIGNNERVRQFAFWAVYLGFAWRLASGQGERLVPDPTSAIGRYLPQVFKPGERTSLREAIRRLGESCPVLETGIVRNEIEASLPQGEPHVLSPATSLALSRLDRKVIELSRESDADTMTLVLPERRIYSHLTYKGGR